MNQNDSESSSSAHSGPAAVTGPTGSPTLVGKRRPGRPRSDGPSDDYRARQAEIVEIAAQVFRAKGYDSGTLDDVAEALDIRRASIYYYVKSKSNLLFMIVDRAIGEALERLDSLDAVSDPRERLEALIRHQVATVTNEPNFFTVFFDHRLHLPPGLDMRVRQQEVRYFNVFVKALADATKAGVIPPIDTRAGAHAILGMTTWAYKWFDAESDDSDLLAETCIALVLGTLAAAPAVGA